MKGKPDAPTCIGSGRLGGLLSYLKVAGVPRATESFHVFETWSGAVGTMVTIQYVGASTVMVVVATVPCGTASTRDGSSDQPYLDEVIAKVIAQVVGPGVVDMLREVLRRRIP